MRAGEEVKAAFNLADNENLALITIAHSAPQIASNWTSFPVATTVWIHESKGQTKLEAKGESTIFLAHAPDQNHLQGTLRPCTSSITVKLVVKQVRPIRRPWDTWVLDTLSHNVNCQWSSTAVIEKGLHSISTHSRTRAKILCTTTWSFSAFFYCRRKEGRFLFQRSHPNRYM